MAMQRSLRYSHERTEACRDNVARDVGPSVAVVGARPHIAHMRVRGILRATGAQVDERLAGPRVLDLSEVHTADRRERLPRSTPILCAQWYIAIATDDHRLGVFDRQSGQTPTEARCDQARLHSREQTRKISAGGASALCASERVRVCACALARGYMLGTSPLSPWS